MFGWHKFGFRFGFEGAQIQILCLDNLKELDLDLAQIHLGFQGSKSMDLKYPQKPRNLEIPHLRLPSVLRNYHALSSSVLTLSSQCFFLSFSQQGLSLSTLFFLFILSISLFLLNLNHKGFGVFCGFHFFLWVCLGFLWFVCGFCLGFVWFVCGFCFIVFSMICFEFVFIFYLHFRSWVCNATYVFDEMLLWTDIYK